MIACYILYSEKLNRFYIGVTQNGVEERIKKHNEIFYGKTAFTAIANDWKLFLCIEVANYNHALRIEKQI
ncbi:MAG: GIY-YIG nuclease family protein [Bacteroidota bacterium]